MLFRGRHVDVPDGTGAGDRHCADLRGQWHGQPPGERHQQGHGVAVAPGRGRADGDAEQRLVVFVVLHERSQPGN